MNKADQKKATTIITNILSLIDLSDTQYTLEFKPDNIRLQLNLNDEDSGVFIGYHGESIASLQLILSLVVSQRLGDWVHVEVNVGDYLERREKTITALADSAVERALSTGKEVMLPNLNPVERRIVHLYLENHDSVVTESRGQAPYRQLMVVPKTK